MVAVDFKGYRQDEEEDAPYKNKTAPITNNINNSSYPIYGKQYMPDPMINFLSIQAAIYAKQDEANKIDEGNQIADGV